MHGRKETSGCKPMSDENAVIPRWVTAADLLMIVGSVVIAMWIMSVFSSVLSHQPPPFPPKGSNRPLFDRLIEHRTSFIFGLLCLIVVMGYAQFRAWFVSRIEVITNGQG